MPSILCPLARAPAALAALLGLGAAAQALANPASDVVGAWQLVSHTVVLDGKAVDTHAALLQQRPCATKIRHVIHADGNYRLDASASDCDEKYKNIQQKLHAKTKWRLQGNKFTTSATNFAVGQTYALTLSGGRMTWVGTEGQGTLVFQKR